MKPLLTLLITFVLATVAHAGLKIAVLHPLLGDIAKQVGGEKVEVVNLVKPGTELHHFDPATKDFASLKGVTMVLAAGKGGESYLTKLTDALGGTARIVDVGATIPSIKIAKGQIDPHWWHSAANMKRAARVIADEFATEDPANADAFKANAVAAGKRLDDLNRWAQQQISQIPKKDRILVSAHNAFAYFCKDYSFRSIPILGLSAEDEATPNQVADTLKVIRDNGVRAVFPEEQANPKVLAEITSETGAKVGTPLNADGTSPGAGSTYDGMLKHNVDSIVAGLKP